MTNELSSPVCYASDADEAYMGYAMKIFIKRCAKCWKAIATISIASITSFRRTA